MKPPFSNALVRSPHHDAIMARYNEILKTNGKVKSSDFWREHIVPVLPNFAYESFRQYLKKLERDSLLPVAQQSLPASVEANKFVRQLKKADEATRRGIELALNIGSEALEKIASGETVLTEKDKADLMFKAMKAQDSRINAMARVRQDKREQLAFEHVFGDAAYAEENE